MDTATEPVDHLAGKAGYTHELLAALTAAELAEQITWVRARRAATAGTKESYMLSNQLSAALREQDSRSSGE